MNDIKQLLLDKLETSEILNQNYAKVFNGELKNIKIYTGFRRNCWEGK